MKRSHHPLTFAAVLLALLSACASTSTRTGAPPAAATATTASPATAAAAPAPSKPAPLADDVVWVRDSAEYRAASAQAFALAGQRVEELAAGRPPGTWAVALDVDETVLSNVEHEVDLEGVGGAFDDGGWQRWVARRSATALPGAIPFLERVHRLGGRIALVTNRDEPQREDTAANLRQQGVPFDVLLLRPSPDRGAKGPRWDAVEQGTAAPGVPPLKIVLWVGDNIKDFPGLDQSLRQAGPEALAAFGDRFVIIPNPMYGSWKVPAPAATPPPTTPPPAATPAPSTGVAPASDVDGRPAATPVAANDDDGGGTVHVDEVQALLEKSLPARLRVIVRGSLADGCTHLGEPKVSRQRRAFHIALPASRDKGRMCTEALVPFEVTVPVSITGLASGTYSVEAGGKTASFTLQQDN